MGTKPIPLPLYGEGSPEWHEQRREGIGSSDASIIMGLSDYESQYSLWEVKTGRAPLDPPRSKRQQEILRFGHLMEPVIRQETATRLGIEITKPDTAFSHPERTWQRCNLDGISSDGRICEFKNTSFFMRDMWDDQIPDHAEIQVHHSAEIMGIDGAIVAGVIGGNELRIFEVDINRNVCDMITEEEAKFWGHVEKNTPPPIDGHKRTYDALTRELGTGKGAKEIDGKDALQFIEAYWEVKAVKANAEKREQTIKNKIAELLAGHDMLITPDGTPLVKTQRGQLNMNNLTSDHPELVEKYTRSVTSFDLKAFKAEQNSVYRQYQAMQVRPQKIKQQDGN